MAKKIIELVKQDPKIPKYTLAEKMILIKKIFNEENKKQ